jgi:hypothetical protein
MKPRQRTLLGTMSGLFDRERVYLGEEAIEKDLISGYDVETRRLFFSDMEMITWHRQFSKAGLWFGVISIAAGLLLMMFISAIVNVSFKSGNHAMVTWVSFWVCVAPNIPIALWFMRPYAYVTVYGKRNRATMSWHFRHVQSRRVFAELAQLVRSFQEHARQQLPQAVPVPAALAPPGEEEFTAAPPASSIGSAELLSLAPQDMVAPEVPAAAPDQPAPPAPLP